LVHNTALNTFNYLPFPSYPPESSQLRCCRC